MASFKGFLKASMPMLSAGLASAGPFGALASNLIGKAVGLTTSNPSEDDLDAAFAKLPPDQVATVIANLKQAEMTFKDHATEMGITQATDFAKIDEQDRESARNREVALKDKFWTPLTLIALVFIGGYFLTLYWVCVHGVSVQNAELAHELVIALTLAVGAIINYYFGASHTQAASTQALADIAKS